MKTDDSAKALPLAKACIDLNALEHNFQQVAVQAPQSQIISVIKANAYGHGLLAIAKALADKSDYLAVARLHEAVFLREQGIEARILLLEGVTCFAELLICQDKHITPVLHCAEQFQCLRLFWQQTQLTLPYWLKLDTGMHRLGFQETDFSALMESLSQQNSPDYPQGIMSHFACADEPEKLKNQKQIDTFRQLNTYLSKMGQAEKINQSMANSAAILAIPKSHFDSVRPGIMLYGISPFEGTLTQDNKVRTGLDEHLLPVMTLSSQLIAIKRLKQGDCIGYGGTWCCPHDMSVGVVAIGYGDGYPRHAPTGTPVLIHNIEVPLVGRVSMDMISVDLSPLLEQGISPAIGDEVVLWGQGLPIEKISQKSGTIAYELLCQISSRVCFNYKIK